MKILIIYNCGICHSEDPYVTLLCSEMYHSSCNNTGITSIADQSGNNRNGVFTNTALTGTVNNFVTPIVTGF